MDGKLEQAIPSLIGALLDFERLGEYEEVLQTSHFLAVASEQMERFSDAIDFYKRGLAAALSLKDSKMAETAAAQITAKLATVIATHGEPDDAAYFLEFALQKAVEREQVELAAEYATHLARIYGQLGDIDGQGRALNNLGNAYRIRGDYAQALKFFKEAAHCFEAAGNQASLKLTSKMIRDLKARTRGMNT